ncbi:hypothetical protein [Halobacillus litoralis]|uniref:Uncharacterized protein n=1 Tax=Halobacillus litoralis TaxID=45668 RepID=A0A410MJD1_9BACI|nr:hypothetical protein [Halobacillus litoralis]QAS54837.1 hypothetical protein HLI_21535 [Halobacillus litoralis]
MTERTNTDKLRMIVEYNEQELHEHGELSDLVTFESNIQEISNPFLSECLRFSVNPFEYYGEDLMEAFIERAAHKGFL